jgi:two-component system, OmpR family, response regulator BaeR
MQPTNISSASPEAALKAAHVVIVEDDASVADMLANYLQAHGYVPHVVSDGALAVATVQRVMPTAVFLDVVLPHVSGTEICAALRRITDAPIIMISARVEEIDRVIGLEMGADDYVCKPFSPREVLARLRALLRRADGRLLAPVDLAGFQIDDEKQCIRWNQKPLPLTRLEFRVFKLLLSRPGHVLSRQSLLDAAHVETLAAPDPADTAADRTIDSHIKNLRRKLNAAGADTSKIESVYGAGYRFEKVGLGGL